MSETAQGAAWFDRSCFGRSGKLSLTTRNTPRGSREKIAVVELHLSTFLGLEKDRINFYSEAQELVVYFKIISRL